MKSLPRREFLQWLVIGGGTFLAAQTVRAQSSSGESARDRFNKLSPEKQEEVRRNWAKFKTLPPEQRRRLIAAHRRFQNLSPEKQTQVRQWVDRWKNLPPERRERVKQRLRKWRRMDRAQQTRVRLRWQRWQNLTEDQRERLRKLAKIRRQNQ